MNTLASYSFGLCLAILGLVISPALAEVRIKDVVTLQAARANQIVGYGLVAGLNDTGDSLRNSPFTEASMKSMLDQLGVGRSNDQFRTKNLAAVLVTADLPPFVGKGTRVDVNVASIGDATSLQGGTLIFTPLYGGDGAIYASAQGSLVVSGFSAEGDAAELVQNTPTSARIPNGAIVETAAPGNLNQERMLILQLINPDFSTAVGITDVINQFTGERYGEAFASELNHQSVRVDVPSSVTPTRFFSQLGSLLIEPDMPARIVVDERTGTVVIGEEVRISTVAVTHGNLTISVNEFPEIVQPAPFSDGITAVQPNTAISADQEAVAMGILKGPTLRELVSGLNLMGAKPSAIIAILQAMKSGGAIQAELIVQ